jgi:hypothetical protein
MHRRRDFIISVGVLVAAPFRLAAETGTGLGLDPRAKIHMPIGIPNTLDTLKTFVEAEGNFSPGFGSYGIYFWIFDRLTGKLTAPTMDGIRSDRGLSGPGLIPWVRWMAGDVEVTSEICEVRRPSMGGDVFLVGARVHVANRGAAAQRSWLYVALRSLGAAGWPVQRLEVGGTDAFLVDGHTALLAGEAPAAIGVSGSDTAGTLALAGAIPNFSVATSSSGDCSGAMRFEIDLAHGSSKSLGFICPVLPGRRAARHKWVDRGQDAMADVAQINPPDGGIAQPDLGPAYYRKISPNELFDEAAAYWKELLGRFRVEVPDRRWNEAMTAIPGHAAMCLNEGAPDVAVVNYNVFNRDGVYVANIMQKSGLFELAEQALNYFLSHPFNGRAYPEADNPGQVLWSLAEQWRFTKDRKWLDRVYPSVHKLAAMIEYYRTTPRPHWVNVTSLDFGESLASDIRQELEPGKCDGYNPAYTEAFDIAGLRGAATLAAAYDHPGEASGWNKLAERLFQSYDAKFGSELPKDYGSYCVLWPCRLYPLNSGKAHSQFDGFGEQHSESWRYFPLATAHQSLLTGIRRAGYATVDNHLQEEEMRGWYLLDEGGGSGSGSWDKVRTKWPSSIPGSSEGNDSVAMPHGWAIAELWLLMRDCLLFEDQNRLVLFPGIVAEWFRDPAGISFENLQTHFGSLSLSWKPYGKRATMNISGACAPPDGFALRLAASVAVQVLAEGQPVPVDANGDHRLPRDVRDVVVMFGN